MLRLPLTEIKLPREKGGLGLLCLNLMAKSLKLSQIMRLLKCDDEKSVGHLDLWIGELLAEFKPGLGIGGSNLSLPCYFEEIALLLTDAKIEGSITSSNWRLVTNKIVYKVYLSDLPPARIETDAATDFSDVWRRICCHCLLSDDRDVMFLLIHRKLAVPERLFRIGLSKDPYCSSCLDVDGVAAINDLEHFFCTCPKVVSSWAYLKAIVINLMLLDTGSLRNIQNLDLISLRFSKCKFEAEITWVIASYINEVWKLRTKDKIQHVNKAKLFGFLKYKYKKDQLGARMQFQCIPELM